MKDDSPTRYGSVTRIFHWGMTLLILWQALKIFDRIDDGEHWVGQTLVPWHISIGSLLLLLIVVRIVWTSKQLGHRPKQDPATALLVHAGHIALYACMVAMPVSGVMLMIGNGYGWAPFGIQLAARGPEIAWMAAIGSLHSPIAWILLILIAGHAGIALLHHFVRKDDVLRRML